MNLSWMPFLTWHIVCWQDRLTVCAGQTGSGVSGITSCSADDGWITSHDGCLFIGVVSKNWTESRVNCKARGSDLASFPSNVHDQVLLDKLSLVSPYWVGYRYNNINPGWLTGTPKVETTRFQTVSTSDQYLCGYVLVSGNGTHRFLQWSLTDCTLPYLSVCMIHIQPPGAIALRLAALEAQSSGVLQNWTKSEQEPGQLEARLTVTASLTDTPTARSTLSGSVTDTVRHKAKSWLGASSLDIPRSRNASSTPLLNIPRGRYTPTASLRDIPRVKSMSSASLLYIPKVRNALNASLLDIPRARNTSGASLRHIPGGVNTPSVSLRHIPRARNTSSASLRNIPGGRNTSSASLRHIPRARNISSASLRHIPNARNRQNAPLLNIPRAKNSLSAPSLDFPKAQNGPSTTRRETLQAKRKQSASRSANFQAKSRSDAPRPGLSKKSRLITRRAPGRGLGHAARTLSKSKRNAVAARRSVAIPTRRVLGPVKKVDRRLLAARPLRAPRAVGKHRLRRRSSSDHHCHAVLRPTSVCCWASSGALVAFPNNHCIDYRRRVPCRTNAPRTSVSTTPQTTPKIQSPAKLISMTPQTSFKIQSSKLPSTTRHITPHIQSPAKSESTTPLPTHKNESAAKSVSTARHTNPQVQFTTHSRSVSQATTGLTWTRSKSTTSASSITSESATKTAIPQAQAFTSPLTQHKAQHASTAHGSAPNFTVSPTVPRKELRKGKSSRPPSMQQQSSTQKKHPWRVSSVPPQPAATAARPTPPSETSATSLLADASTVNPQKGPTSQQLTVSTDEDPDTSTAESTASADTGLTTTTMAMTSTTDTSVPATSATPAGFASSVLFGTSTDVTSGRQGDHRETNTSDHATSDGIGGTGSSSAHVQVGPTPSSWPQFKADTSLGKAVDFVTGLECNMSVECMSYVLLHPDLPAEVKVDLLNSDLVPCPSCDPDPNIKGDNTTLTSDRWRRGIQRFFRVLNRYLVGTHVRQPHPANDDLEQNLLTMDRFLERVMGDLRRNSTMHKRFSHLEFQILQLATVEEVRQFHYRDQENVCNVSQVDFNHHFKRKPLRVVLVTVVMHVPNRNVLMTAGDSADSGVVTSPLLLLSGYVNGRPRSLRHSFRLRQPFKGAQANDSYGPRCVFLDDRSRMWSTYGCEVVNSESEDDDSGEGDVECRCNHTSNFAILMQIVPFKMAEAHRVALSIITYIGCSITLITQFMAITVFTCIGSLNCERVCVHRNLCIAIVGAQVTFLAGIEAVEHRLVCAVVAVLLHYCYTAVFIWMLVEGLHLYSKVVRVFGTERSRMTYYVCFGWGVPLVLVTISAAADWEGYGTPTSCWLSTQRNTIWAFVGPALAILIVNLVILAAVVKIVMASAKLDKHGEFDHIRAGVKAALLLLPLLGLTWVFGLAAVNQDLIIFQYLFALFNTLQGFFIFLFHCVFNTEVRQALRRLQERRSLQRGDLSSLAGFSTSPSVSPTPSVQDQKKPLGREESPFGDLSESVPYKGNRVVPARYTATTNIVSSTVPSSTRNTARERRSGTHNTTRRKTEDMGLMFI